MASLSSVQIYIAIRKQEERSRVEDQLVLDGANVSSFSSAEELWKQFQIRPVRFVITDHRFGGEFDGLRLVRRIRKYSASPYVYVLMRSVREQLKDIREGLSLGVDDYLIKPHNPFQLRSRVLVGMRWLTYIDSLKA
jgi:DNA-binding response OmpR family regulator